MNYFDRCKKRILEAKESGIKTILKGYEIGDLSVEKYGSFYTIKFKGTPVPLTYEEEVYLYNLVDGIRNDRINKERATATRRLLEDL